MKIVLVCTAGMSTSMLVTKMDAVAKKRGLDAKIWAVGDAESKKATDEADVVLLGPQVKYLKKKIETQVDNKKPVAVIDTLTYGTMNGEKALDFAIEQYENFGK